MRHRALLSSTAGLAATAFGATALPGLAVGAALDSPEFEFATEQSSRLEDV